MTTDSPLVSVIVPVYNVGDYVSQCIESIVNQTYTNLEILIVDDGSTDNSGTLCDQWAQRDRRITVYHQANRGLSAARNTALDVMKGDYVTMVDSDDVITESCIAHLLDLLLRHDADVAIGSWLHFSGENLPTQEATTSTQETCYDTLQAMRAIYYQHSITNSACSRLYKAELFDGLRYPVGKLYEDVAMVYPLMSRVHKTVKSNQIVYYYRQRPSSILGQFSPQRADILDELEQLEQQVTQENEALLPAVRSRLLSAYFNILILCSSQHHKPHYNQLASRCWKGIKRLRHNCLNDPCVRRKNKLGILCSYIGKKPFCALFSKIYHPKR